MPSEICAQAHQVLRKKKVVGTKMHSRVQEEIKVAYQ
jgi:hypothetical protein